jgi:hypothetical protein
MGHAGIALRLNNPMHQKELLKKSRLLRICLEESYKRVQGIIEAGMRGDNLGLHRDPFRGVA